MANDLESLIAKQEITELVYRYMRGLDRFDEALLRSLFTDDAWCEYGFMNGDAADFISFALGALAGHSANQHFVGNILIDLEGDEAFGEVYFNAYHKVPAEEGYSDLIVAGRYLDRYERSGGAWKFAYRAEWVDWSSTAPCSDSYFELVPDGLIGRRKDDALYDRARRYRPAGK